MQTKINANSKDSKTLFTTIPENIRKSLGNGEVYISQENDVFYFKKKYIEGSRKIKIDLSCRQQYLTVNTYLSEKKKYKEYSCIWSCDGEIRMKIVKTWGIFEKV